MDFTYPVEAETFRSEVRTWLDHHLTDRFRGLEAGVAAGPERLERLREWNRILADAGYAAITWPKEWGGREASVMEQVVFAEELHRARAPGPVNVIGLPNIAPAIIEHGTDEQKRRFLLRMLRADDIWCQGFSEPEAGSDLAGLRTRAERDGDHYVVNGQKVWTTLGPVATWCELLVRTDPTAPKHRGITCLLVDLSLPGIESRPLVTITGEPEFGELFVTDVRVPVSAVRGAENEGWRVAMTTLTNERGGVAALHLRVREQIQGLIRQCRDLGRTADPVARQQLARLYLDGEMLKLLADRAISGQLHERPGGPESSLIKLCWSETSQRLAELTTDLLGEDGLHGAAGRGVLAARSLTLAGGTTQVQKNIIAQRILGLPRR
jgi:alkylation response protein AidB-like acyl-CoA dehydrogenase